MDKAFDLLDDFPEWQDRESSVLKRKFKDKFKNIFDEYKDPKKGDKLLKAIKRTEDVKEKAYKNLRNVIQENQNLEVLEEATEKLKLEANAFRKETKKVENHMKWESRKWILYTTLILGALGGFLYFEFL